MSPLRALPSLQSRASYDQLHHECQVEQARRTTRLLALIGENIDYIADLTRDYEELVDRYNETRAELAACKAWFAGHPLHHSETTP